MVAPNSSSPSPAEPPEDDPMGPPKVPCEVECVHCGNHYLSSEIRWRPDPNGPDGGWWVCPIDGCDGAGFCFDIFPTDPAVARQFGVEMWTDDDEDDEFDDDDDEGDEGEEWKRDPLTRDGARADDHLPLDDGDDDAGDDSLFDRTADDPSERPPPPRRRLTDDEPFTDDDIPF